MRSEPDGGGPTHVRQGHHADARASASVPELLIALAPGDPIPQELDTNGAGQAAIRAAGDVRSDLRQSDPVSTVKPAGGSASGRSASGSSPPNPVGIPVVVDIPPPSWGIALALAGCDAAHPADMNSALARCLANVRRQVPADEQAQRSLPAQVRAASLTQIPRPCEASRLGP